MVDQVGTVEPVKKVAGFAGEKYNTRKTVEDEEKELEELKKRTKCRRKENTTRS